MALPLHVDPKDPTPIYAQLERAIRVGIATARLQPGQQLPTVRQLAVELRVNANTVARVYLNLERDGVLQTKRGVGTFIAEAQVPGAHDQHRERRLKSISDKYLTEATSLGYAPREVVRYLAQRIKEGA
jgi:GntR family transcriptional regulator